MDVTLAYLGRSGLREDAGTATLQLAPNLARDPVAFDAPLRRPLRFREAVSALHDVVVSDLKYKPRDKSAYEAWKKDEERREAALRHAVFAEKKAAVLAARGDVPPDLERDYARCRRRYWDSRQAYANHLLRNDRELWRMLMPCDPVITVADDVVFFECFSADESAYGCLTVDRDGGFGRADARYGTTNVDYPWALYDHFQSLRSYRETRFRMDPEGFEVATAGRPDYREEKIALPPGWLRGFMQTQAAMALPMRRVTLSREAVYSILARLKRRKARTSPRALRFELVPDRPPAVVIEPWEERIVSHGTLYRGPQGEAVRVWGRQRLLVLARTLALADGYDVHLLGTGLPSFWVARMGEMRLTLGLSGWTANDWTRGSAIDLLAPPGDPSADLLARVEQGMRSLKSAMFAEIDAAGGGRPAQTAAALHRLAHAGQVIYDLHAGVYRWRSIMPRALGEAEIGPENPELLASRDLVARRRAAVSARQEAPGGGTLFSGTVDGKPIELLLDGDGRIRRGKCGCSHHFRFGLRTGPCRHLLAMRVAARERREDKGGTGKAIAAAMVTGAIHAAVQVGLQQAGLDAAVDLWYERLRHWARG